MAAGHSRQHAPADHVRPGRRRQQQAGLLRVGQEQLRPALRRGLVASRRWRAVRLADRRRQAGRPRRLLDGLRPHRPGAGHAVRSGRVVRPVNAAVVDRQRQQRRQPGHPVPGDQRDSRTRCRKRLPEASPRRRRSQAGQITSALDSSIKTPYSHVYNVVVGRELGGDYSLRGRLRRAHRTEPADPARPDDAAELQGPEERNGLLHGREADDRCCPRVRGSAEHRADSVLGEHVP